jgi:hypothetical protein
VVWVLKWGCLRRSETTLRGRFFKLKWLQIKSQWLCMRKTLSW